MQLSCSNHLSVELENRCDFRRTNENPRVKALVDASAKSAARPVPVEKTACAPMIEEFTMEQHLILC
jgi:hypothetical protein